MKKLIIISILALIFAGCAESTDTNDTENTSESLSESGECVTSSDCETGLNCENEICTLPPPPPPCSISGLLYLPAGVDASNETYTLSIDTDTLNNLNEVLISNETWTSGDTHEYSIDISNITNDTYYIYANINVGGTNYIGYFDGTDITPPANANATIDCSETFDITLAEIIALYPDNEISSENFPTDGIGGTAYSGSFEITNSGDANGSEDITYQVYLSNNSTLEPATDTLVDEATISALNISDTSGQINFSGTWPANGGYFYLIINISAPDDNNLSNNLQISTRLNIAVPKRAIAVGSNGTILYSDDFGVTWHSTSSGTSNILRAAAQSQNGRWVIVGYNGTALYSTNDGINWTVSNSNTTNHLNGVTSFETNGFMAVGAATGPDPYGMTRSLDGGATWAQQVTMTILHGITTRGDSTLVTVGHTASTYEGCAMFTYTSGAPGWATEYIQIEGQPAPALYDVTYTGSRFVAVGSQISMYSSGGGNWKKGATSPQVPTTMYGIAWSNPQGRLVAVGQSGKVIYGGSSGQSWTQATSGTSAMLYDVATDNAGRFIAVGSNGTIIYSHDAGITWHTATSGTSEILWGVAFSK